VSEDKTVRVRDIMKTNTSVKAGQSTTGILE